MRRNFEWSITYFLGSCSIIPLQFSEDIIIVFFKNGRSISVATVCRIRSYWMQMVVSLCIWVRIVLVSNLRWMSFMSCTVSWLRMSSSAKIWWRLRAVGRCNVKSRCLYRRIRYVVRWVMCLRHLLEKLLVVAGNVITGVIYIRHQIKIIITCTLLIWSWELSKTVITERVFMNLTWIWLILLVLLSVSIFAPCVISLFIIVKKVSVK